MVEKEKPSKRTIRRGIAVLVILFVMLVCILMITLLLVFQIRKIKVTGNTYITSGEIQDWVEQDDAFGNSLYLMYKVHFTDFPLLPTMEDVKIKMVNPWTIQVDVAEKKAVGYIVMPDEECVYFDEDGMVLAKTTEWWDNIPRVDGISLSDVTLYEELPVSTENKKALKSLLEISTTLARHELVPASLSVVDSEVYLYFGNKCVILGHENIENRIEQITPILEKLGDQKGTLHLEDYNEKNTTIRFEKDFLPSEAEGAAENAE